jgi:DeoR/GlpR family transcriptional regulator of sugar metabolism
MLDLINELGFCSVTDLGERLGVSRMTVRRDIQQLEEQQLVRSSHGGVAALAPRPGGTHFQLRSDLQSHAKRAIAKRAAELILDRPGAIVGIDAGTSAFQVARQLHPQERCTVVTHSLPVMNELSERPNIQVIGIGGVLHPETQAFAGPATIAALQKVRLDILILGTSAIRDGVMYCGNAFDADTKREMIRISDQTVLLVDSSKFERLAAFDTDDLAKVSTAITDDGIAAEDRQQLTDAGVEVLVAPAEPVLVG